MMVQIEDKIISLDVFDRQFACDLSACKGACCVDGDAGAPLNDDELSVLSEIFDEVKPYMRQEGIDAIEEQGFYVVDSDGDNTTPLINNNECAFVSFDVDGIAKCSIEQTYNDGKIDFKKPISCHLYHIRIAKYTDFEALNYDRRSICSDACALGEELKVPVYRFLKEPLIRKYGPAFYDELEEVAAHLSRS